MSEVIGTLLKYLMSILAVGALSLLANNVQQEISAGAAIAGISQLAADIKKLYGGQQGFGTLNNNQIALDDPSIVPSDWAGWVNQWGGGVTVTGGSASFAITLGAVPLAACREMIALVQATSADGGGSGQIALPSPTQAIVDTGQCPSSSNSVKFVFQ